MTALLVSYDIIEASADMSLDVPPVATEDTQQGRGSGPRFPGLLKAYDLMPPNPIVSNNSAVFAKNVSGISSPIAQNVVKKATPAVSSVSANSGSVSQPVSVDALTSAKELSPRVSRAVSIASKKILRYRLTELKESVWEALGKEEPDPNEDPFPAEMLSVADLLASQPSETAAADAEAAAGLDAAAGDAAVLRGEKRDDAPRSLASAQTGGKKGRPAGEPELIAGVAVASRNVSRPAMNAARMKDSQRSNYTKRRTLKKMRPQFRRDRAEVTPLMLAAVNPTDAAPEIIAWLLEQGEELEARDGEGRTALVCAVRYNSSPSAARALIEAGADTRARFNGNTLRRLLRFNPRMSERDKKTLLPLLKGKSAQ